MPRRLIEEPYVGTPPDVHPGDLVWCRSADGTWVRKLALSVPRYDHSSAFGPKVLLTIQVASLHNAYLRRARIGWYGQVDTCNWPATDVRPNSVRPPGPLYREPKGLE